MRSGNSRVAGSLTLKVFGPPALVRQDDAAPVQLRRKDLALLVYLRVNEGIAFSRSALAALLWGGSPERQARHSLSQALSRLAVPLGALLDVGTNVVLRHGLPSEVELEGRDPSELPLKPFLDGFAVGEGGEDFDRWTELRREELRRSVLRLLDQQGQAAEASAKWDEALASAERGVELDPYWEDGHRRILRAWVARGERSRALRHYEALSERLRRDVGADCAAETTELARSIREQASSLAGAATQPKEEGAEEPRPPAVQPVEITHPHGGAGAAQATETSGEPIHGTRLRPLSWWLRGRWTVTLLASIGILVLFAIRAKPSRNAAPGVAGPATAGCRAGDAVARFLSETYPDNVPVPAGQPFVKSWTLRNTGTCTWTRQFILRYEAYSSRPLSQGPRRIPLHRDVPPGDTVVVSVPMLAPTAPGLYREDWSLRDPENAVVPVSSSQTIWAKVFVPPTNTQACTTDDAVAKFVREDLPDDSEVAPGVAFVKTWVLRNDGRCTWPASWALRFVSSTGTRLSNTETVEVGRSVRPGEEVSVSVRMRAPRAPGTFREDWRLAAPDGDSIRVSGSRTVWVQVVVPTRLR